NGIIHLERSSIVPYTTLFRSKDYNLVNYIEIWNSNQPQDKSESILAYDFWVDKLKKGYEISCSAVRDWHRPDTLDANMGVTYLDIPESELPAENFKASLGQGQFYVTLGAVVELQLQAKDVTRSYHIGDRVESEDFSEGQIQVRVEPTELRDLTQFA